MAEAEILSAIESLECWLLKKGGIREENLEKLYSLIVWMSDFGEEKKEMLHTLLLQFEMAEEDEERERKKEKLYKLLDMNKEKMYRLVVGMTDFWEDYKGKLYSLLMMLLDSRQEQHRHDQLFEIADLWGDDQGQLDKAKLQILLLNKKDLYKWLATRVADCEPWYLFNVLLNDSLYLRGTLDIYDFLVEIAHRHGDYKGELNKDTLHYKLDKFGFDKKMMMYISNEVACLWTDKQPELNKEKLCTWLANKVDLREARYLFGVLLDAVLLYDSSSYEHQAIREGVEGAKREFRLILDLITDKNLGEESSLRYFISDVVDMANDSRFLIQLQDSDPFVLFFELSIFECHAQEWLIIKFKDIVRALQEIKVSMLGFEIERLQNAREMEGSENVVRSEEEVKLLLQCKHDTIVITGMVGIGKTALARQVYNHTTITQQFERRAWVCLSKEFSRKEMLVSLLRQVVDSKELASLENIERADYKSLKQMLRQQLWEKRYFIVLDDAWEDTTHFKYVTKALHRDAGSKLLLTSGKGRIWLSEHINRYEVNFYKMKYMDDDKSWTLLLKMLSIEGSDEKFPKPLVMRARQILRRYCGGLPLAITEVGRHWAKKRQSGSKWEEVIESIDLSETLRALESVYHSWDQELQSCFLPLAFFKEGATLKATKLVQIWIIMGVVPGSKEKYETCLEGLCTESIIDVIDRDKIEGNIKKCCIHPVFHRLSMMKAEDELNFEILNKDGKNRPSHQPHHRVVYYSREKLMNYSSSQDKHLVSLFLYGGGYFNASPSYWKHFEQLKTLDMEDFGLKILPDVIGTLSELRYLGLRNNYIQELPHSLSRLKKLEVLDIALNFMVEVEDIIWEMESLRHLFMSDISYRKPLRFDTLKTLETLTYISAHNWTYVALRLEMMTSLSKLGIQEVHENTDVSKLFAELAKLRNLESLILRGSRFKSMPSLDEIGLIRYLPELKLEGLITRLPPCANNFPVFIKRLSLVNSCLREDPMPILKELIHLAYLKLQNAYVGQEMVILRRGFYSLLVLIFEELWHLSKVRIKVCAMQELKDLQIKNCPNLKNFPATYDSPQDHLMFEHKVFKNMPLYSSPIDFGIKR